MIRVTVEHVQYVQVTRPPGQDYEILEHPTDYHPKQGEVREIKSTMLLQELGLDAGHRFDIRPLLCLMNDIEAAGDTREAPLEVVALSRITPEIVAALKEAGLIPSEEQE